MGCKAILDDLWRNVHFVEVFCLAGQTDHFLADRRTAFAAAVRLSYEDPIDAITKSPTMSSHSGRRIIGVIEFFGAWHLGITLGGFYALLFKRDLAILCSLIYAIPTFTFAFTGDIALRHFFDMIILLFFSCD